MQLFTLLTILLTYATYSNDTYTTCITYNTLRLLTLLTILILFTLHYLQNGNNYLYDLICNIIVYIFTYCPVLLSKQLCWCFSLSLVWSNGRINHTVLLGDVRHSVLNLFVASLRIADLASSLFLMPIFVPMVFGEWVLDRYTEAACSWSKQSFLHHFYHRLKLIVICHSVKLSFLHQLNYTQLYTCNNWSTGSG